MQKILILSFYLFFTSSSGAQSTYFKWAKQFKGEGTDVGEEVKVDHSGNVYSSGVFNNSADFDPGTGVLNLTATGTLGIYISKLNANGNLVWAKSISGPTDVSTKSLNLDASGNIYITGSFSDSADFDPGPGVFKLFTEYHAVDIFILKLNSNGDFIWAKQMKGSLNKESLAAYNDNSGNLYLTGYFGATTDFDPGPAVYSLTPVGANDIFILKLDPSGNLVWAKSVGSDDDESATGITGDNAGNVYVTGYFFGAADFDPGIGSYFLSSNGAADIFILKLNSNGNFIWARSMGGPKDDHGYSLAADVAGNIYVTGYFEGDADFDPGPGGYILSAAGDGIFVTELNSSGQFVWAKSMAGTAESNWGFDLCIDDLGYLYITGHFNGSIDFDPGPSSTILTSSYIDLFILKLDAAGNFIWVRSTGGSGNDQSHSICVDQFKNIYTTGFFSSTVDFDPDAGVYNLAAGNSEDIYVEKIAQCNNSSGSFVTASGCTSYTLNGQTYNTSGEFTQTLFNAFGCDSIITLQLTITTAKTNISASVCEGQSYYAGGQNQTIPGIYSDTLHTSAGCDSIIITNLIVHAKPLPDLGADRAICIDQPLILNPGTFSSYTWQDNSTLPVFAAAAEGKYWVTVTDAAGCASADTIYIAGTDTIPKNFLPADPVICSNNSLNIAISGYTDYLWNTGAVTGNISIDKPGKYYLAVTNSHNCKGTDSMLVKRSDCGPSGIPGAFSPNGDGLNDIFRPFISRQVYNYDLIIFNRYGVKIFETKNYHNGWDGTYKGKKQLPGTYIYFIAYEDSAGFLTTEKGAVLLLR